MKRSLLLFFCLFLCHFYMAHKPKVVTGTFGNIKTYFNSAFNFGTKTIESEEAKMKVVGELSKIISERLGYADTILIERVTYYPNYPDEKLFILESNNSQYKLPFLSKETVTKTNNYGLAIRILCEKVDIIDILKLVEYTILNRKKINNYLIPTPYVYNRDGDKLSILANSESFIKKILKKKSPMVDEVVNNDIEILNNGYLSTRIFWKKGEFIFRVTPNSSKKGEYLGGATTQYKVKDFKYYIDSAWAQFFLIFDSMSTFSYFDGEDKNTSFKVSVENKSSFFPFRLVNEVFSDKIILYDTNEYFFIYNFRKKLLQKIE
ncbi:hypothetical protein CHRYSEOSP005_25600 [Chryseobacterium sp. Alg-005]|uniref:hypothetical protein n=1 Tax=Chryseobacterium sp. Alg-005 TaxID=3159516 RepID=UPI003555B3FE